MSFWSWLEKFVPLPIEKINARLQALDPDEVTVRIDLTKVDKVRDYKHIRNRKKDESIWVYSIKCPDCESVLHLEGRYEEFQADRTYQCPKQSCKLLLNFERNARGYNTSHTIKVWRNPEIAGALSETD